MDVIDRANELSEWLLSKQLQAQVGRSTSGDSRFDCESCADPIPEGRRVALPGVALCIECQSEQEQMTR